MHFSSTPFTQVWLKIQRQELWDSTSFMLTQSKYKTQITRSVHCKFNCITVKYNGTQHGIYILWLVPSHLHVETGNIDSGKKYDTSEYKKAWHKCSVSLR